MNGGARADDRSEIRFQAGLLDAVGQAVIATDLQGSILYWNRAAERLYGWSREETLGRNVMDVTPTDATREQAEEIMACIRKGESWSGEFTVRRKDGSTFPAWVVDTPLKDVEGRVVGVVGVSEDHTPRKLREARTRELAAIVDATEEALIATDVDGTITSWNAGAERTYGYTAEEAIGRPVKFFVPEALQGELEELYSAIRNGESVRQHETQRIHRDGRLIDVSLSVAPLRDGSGAIRGFTGTSRDISERKRTAEEIRLREERFRMLAENLPITVCRFDRDRRLVYMNRNVERTTGDAPEVLIRKLHADEVPAPGAKTLWREHLERVLATGEPAEFEFEYPAPSGPRRFEARLVPEPGPGGDVEYVLAISQDITNQKRTEQNLAFLGRASSILAASLDYRRTLDRVTKLAVPDLADWSGVYLEEDGEFSLVAVHHSDEKRVEALERALENTVPSPDTDQGILEVIRSGEPELVKHVNDDVLRRLARSPEHLAFLRTLGLRSLLIVPLQTSSRTLGALTFATAESERVYDEETLRLGMELARRAALAVDNARLHRDTARAARDAQERAERLHGLAEAALAISSDLSLEETLERVTDEARHLVGAHQAVTSLTLDDDWAQAIDHVSLSDKYAEYREFDEPPRSRRIYRLVCERNRPMRLTQADLEEHPAWEDFSGQGDQHPPLRGWLAAPLVGRDGRNIGLIQVSDRHEGDFTAEDEDILVQLAQMASAAVENARLFQAAQAAEARARNQLEFTRAIASSMGEGVYALDRDGLVTFANPAAERVLGYTEADLLGTSMHDRIHVGHGDASFAWEDCAIHDVLRTGDPVTREGVFQDCDGCRFAVEYTAAPILERGEVVGVVVTFQDVTDRQRQQAELEAARRQVAVSEKLSALGTLVTGVAHEIRTPLTFASNHLFLLQRRLEQALDDETASQEALEEALRSVDEVAAGIQRVNHLVKDLRRYTRLESGHRNQVRFSTVVADAVRLFNAAYRGRIHVDAQMESASDLALDEVQVQQVVLNLLSNSAEAMPDGGVVHVRTRDDGPYAVLTVEDEGPGIPEALRDHLFEPFRTSKEEGTGLGLSIVKRIVDAHAGDVHVETAPGNGTRFEIRFPKNTGGGVL